MEKESLVPAAEFQTLPLSYIIAEPLKAAVEAQSVAAQTTLNFIKGLIKDGKPITVDFSASIHKSANDNETIDVNVTAPLLAITPIPHLRIDSITTHFRYEISSVSKQISDTGSDATLDVQTGAALSPWVKASLKGTVSSKSSSESVMNRSGVLEITVNASEAPMPEGLAKILGILNNAITVTEKPTTAIQQNDGQ